MRIMCPCCGLRDRREFTYRGAALALSRPDPEASAEVWDDYLHNRDNPAGLTEELWYHAPCGSWIVVSRDTVTHEITQSRLARDAVQEAAP